tara:strand:+ start:951 stop:1196 length:246 start_codon:yes stop_codon:yes gene_type:complete
MRTEYKEITRLSLENSKLKEENDKLKAEISRLKNNNVIKNPNQLSLFEDETPKIYESPDGGKTIYQRDFGDYNGITKKKLT